MLPSPVPSAGLAAYEAEREARFHVEPRALENWRKINRSAEVDYLPSRLDIENVSRCNFACTMCAVSKWPKGQRAKDMPVGDFKRLIDEQVGLVEIKLNGIGEPLMAGEEFFEMIRYARERRIWVRITTNASLLHLKDNYKKLIDSGVNEIDISIDGADAQTFEGIRIQSDFSRVAANCILLNDYARSQGKPSAKMWTLVQKANQANLPSHVQWAKEHGFTHLVFSLGLHGWGDTELAQRNHAEETRIPDWELWLLVERGLKLGVRVAFWNTNTKFSTASPKTLCPWPFDRAVVTSDSRTVPCCMIGSPDAFEFGRGSGKTFLENWQGGEYRAFRQAHLDGKVPQVCKGCYQ